MKAYIGPYPKTRVVSHSLYRKYMSWKHKKYYFSIDEADETKFDRALEKVADFIDDTVLVPVNWLLAKRSRKIKIRIDNYDVWNADYTIALIVLPMLKMLKESKHGSPCVDDEDVPEHLRTTAATTLTQDEKDTGHTDDLWEDRWDYVLNEMIHTFECTANNDWEDQFYSGEHDLVWEDVEVDGKKFKQMNKGPKDTFKVDHDSMKVAWDRRKEGLRLFGKYYHALWD